jgi:hypothetical protein
MGMPAAADPGSAWMSLADTNFVLPAGDAAAPAALAGLAEALAQGQLLQVFPAGSPAVALPEELRRVLQLAVEQLSAGRAVSITPHDTVLTLGQAADLLGVSRSGARAMVDKGDLVTTSLGTLQGVRLEDVLAARDRLTGQARCLDTGRAAS